MKGLLYSFWLLAAVFAVLVIVAGCAQLPTVQHCEQVRYERTGLDIRIEAHCRAPVGGVPGL